MNTIDILTIIDPEGFADNDLSLTTPITSIPNLPSDLLKSNVWMLSETKTMVRGQGTDNITIKAKKGDSIRWWDSTLVQGKHEDIIIVGFQKGANWDANMEKTNAETRGTAAVYVKSGFDIGSLSNLTFAQNSYQNNYIQSTVSQGASVGSTIYYYLVVAKFDTSSTSGPVLKGLYRFDPGIEIVE